MGELQLKLACVVLLLAMMHCLADCLKSLKGKRSLLVFVHSWRYSSFIPNVAPTVLGLGHRILWSLFHSIRAIVLDSPPV